MQNLKKTLFILLSALSLTTTATANPAPCAATTSVPINCTLNPSSVLTANYSFNAKQNALYCFTDTLQSGIINWSYAGKIYPANLPVLLSKKGGDKRYLIDPYGTFTITNNTAKALVVNC